jgi:hypothetical protein
MTRIVTATSLILMVAVVLTGCGGQESTVVQSGTYEGTIQEVNAEENEIYVEVPNTGTLELYFTEKTTLTRNGNSVPFDTLETGQSVEVEVERVGQRLDPVAVRILE